LANGNPSIHEMIPTTVGRWFFKVQYYVAHTSMLPQCSWRARWGWHM